MAARTKRPNHDEKTRKKIQASQLINRLTKHVLGEVEMSSSQVRAAEVLLKKSLPDLVSTELTGEGGGPMQGRWTVEIVGAESTNSKET